MGQFYMEESDAKSLDGRCVLLLDDIVTTGAGMAACAAALREAGAGQILAFAVATVPDKRNEKVTK